MTTAPPNHPTLFADPAKPPPAQSVTISAIGHCNAATRLGSYEVLLESGANRRYLCAEVQDTTVNRCILHGLIAGVRVLRFPCRVELVAATSLGFSLWSKGKGPNRDLVGELVGALDAGGHVFAVTEHIDGGGGAMLRAKIELAATTARRG